MDTSIQSIVRDAEDNYTNGSSKISEYVDFDMYDRINVIDAYLNSRHVSGSQDSLGRDKPFFDIVTAASNIWYRATDIDRKNIRILPSQIALTAHAFIATVLLQEWMRKSRFGIFLNEWGRILARYGSAVVKFVEQDGELKATVIPWNRLIVDPISFDAIPTIEKLYVTPQELKKNKSYDQEVVKGLLDAQSTRKTLDGKQQDDTDNFIEIYEVHGDLPTALLKDEPSEATEAERDTYRQQMHVVSFVQTENGEFEDFTLYKGREAKHPYKITHLIKEDGRTLAIGAVEHLLEAQWMVNHAQKNIKDTLDLASKLIFQTADPKFIGRNVLSAIETGDIMIHAVNMPLTQLNNSKADITAFQNFSGQWQQLAAEITSTPDAMKGTTMPSGTPYSLGAFLGAQANSLFEIMTENKGLDLEDMMREYIIPHLKKKMNTKEEVLAILDDNAITELDAMYIPREAVRRHNEKVKKTLIMEDGVPSPFQKDIEEQQVKESVGALGNMRPFKPSDLDNSTWEDSLKDLEMNVIVEVTNENTDKQAVLTTLSTLLQTIAGNPAILQDPNAKMLFNQILKETAHISPIQLTTAQASPPQPQGGTDALQGLTPNNNGGTATS